MQIIYDLLGFMYKMFEFLFYRILKILKKKIGMQKTIIIVQKRCRNICLIFGKMQKHL